MAAITACLLAVGAAAAQASPISLLLPQSAAFSVLGHSCGGIQEQVSATGFDAASGYPQGQAYISTRCGGSGRGGGYHVTTYSAWVGVTWDFTGTMVSYEQLAGATTVDPSYFDANGNEIYNQSSQAFLALAAGYIPVPRLTGISVSQGPAAGGTSVTISGTGFSAASSVSFGGTAAASFVVNSDTSITAVSPAAGPGPVEVTVTSGGGTSATIAADQFTFVGRPSVSALSPDSGSVYGGMEVTITGTNLADATGVSFGENLAGFSVDSDTSITAYVPPGEAPDTVDIRVTSIGGTSAKTTNDQFTYTPRRRLRP